MGFTWLTCPLDGVDDRHSFISRFCRYLGQVRIKTYFGRIPLPRNVGWGCHSLIKQMQNHTPPKPTATVEAQKWRFGDSILWISFRSGISQGSSYYTLENKHGTKTWRFGRWFSFSVIFRCYVNFLVCRFSGVHFLESRCYPWGFQKIPHSRWVANRAGFIITWYKRDPSSVNNRIGWNVS